MPSRRTDSMSANCALWRKTLQHTVAAATVSAPSVSAITSSGMARKIGESRTAKPAVSPAAVPNDRDVTDAATAAVEPAMADCKIQRDDGVGTKQHNDDRLQELEKRRPVADRDFRKMCIVVDKEGNRPRSEARRQIIGDRYRRHIVGGFIGMIAAIAANPPVQYCRKSVTATNRRTKKPNCALFPKRLL